MGKGEERLTSITNFVQNLDLTQLFFLLLSAVATLMCITIHELSHGFVAYKLGDPTAKNAGRLTLNPIKHLDLLGFLMMITVHIGWAKPVPVDMRYFRHPKRDMAITALAGPVSNILTAWAALLVGSGLYQLLYRMGSGFSDGAVTVLSYVILFLCYVAVLSVGLGLFNLIPIPPLDGAKIFFSVLPDKVYYQGLKYEKYIMIVMLIVAWTGVFSGPLNFLMGGTLRGLCAVSGFPYQIISTYFF